MARISAEHLPGVRPTAPFGWQGTQAVERRFQKSPTHGMPISLPRSSLATKASGSVLVFPQRAAANAIQVQQMPSRKKQKLFGCWCSIAKVTKQISNIWHVVEDPPKIKYKI